MVRYLKIIFPFIVLYIFGCNDVFEVLENDEDDEPNNPSYIFEIEPNLPMDDNGYYHLTLNRNTWQTTHRIDGRVTDQENNPVFYYWVEWESDLYWYLGDTLGYIVNRYLNNTGVYVSVDTSYIIGFNGQEVPTSNGISYSNDNGEISNMIAPVRSMIGDTMKLSYHTYDNDGYIKIVLD